MEGPEAAGKCVLIVEDNPLNLKLFSAMIEAQGYGVLSASDGPRGLEMARQERPDLIIMDVNLPGMSGIELTHVLKDGDDTRDIPIIVTTAFGMRDDIRACGCDAFMAKPIGVADFLGLIDSLLARPARQPAASGA